MNDNQRREEILREIGISPVWRLRAAVQVEGAGAPPQPAEQRLAEPAAHAVTQPPAPPAKFNADRPVQTAPDTRPADIANMDWAALKSCVADCTACDLHKTRNKTVFGVGDENAGWLFVGEGPGADEDAEGEPFVGQAGRLLDNMLAAIDLRRGADVYIANIVKCRPPGNRNPQPGEAQACAAYLQRQIALIRPKLIIALGKVAAVNLLGRDASISSLRGTVHDYRGIPLIVTYHPAYLLRTLHDKAKAWEDLCFAVQTFRALPAHGDATL